MHKYIKLKTSREFLKKDFPENILPIKKSSKKDKNIIKEKLSILRKIKKRIKKLDEFLQTKIKCGTLNEIYPNINYDKSNLNKKVCFLFSSDQIRFELLQKQNQNKTLSDFLLKMKEKKKISILYGNISRKFYQKAFIQAQRKKGRVNENLLIEFETRLDVLLYRICFFKNIAAARQSINHKLILVNGTIVNISSYQVRPGDVISIDSKKKKFLSNQLMGYLKKNLIKRRFRFFLSIKHLKRRLQFGKRNQNNKNYTDYNQTKKLQINLKKIFRNLKKKSNTFNRTKQISFLECFLRINLLTKLPLDKSYYLRLKKLMYKKPSRRVLLSMMRISAMKPINVEVSYKLLQAIVLFTPQKIVFPATISIDLLSRSLAQN